jgi:hypothetical protein
MAKKKTKKTAKEHLLSPISLKRTLSYVGLFSIISGINIYAFIITPPEIKQEIITQQHGMDVLGETITLETDNKQNYAPFYNKPEVTYWYNVLQEKPDFRDAHLILATLAYNDHNCQLAQSHLTQAFSIDPTDTRIASLTNVIQECR